MRFAVAYSRLNIAGKNIVDEFRKICFTPQIPIIELKKETLYSDDLNESNYPELKNIDFIVFASTHRSEKKFPSLCLHAPGNYRTADLGGRPGKLCPTSCYVMKYLFQEFNKNFEENKNTLSKEYNLTMEVSHHGPLIDIPCCFIELGSSEEEWNDIEAARIVAKTIYSLEDYFEKKFESWIPAIGIGGPHYAPNFNKMQLLSNYAIGHIIPEHALPLNESILKEVELKTKEHIKEVLIDWKGCGKSEDRQKVLDLLEKMGFKYRRTSHVEK